MFLYRGLLEAKKGLWFIHKGKENSVLLDKIRFTLQFIDPDTYDEFMDKSNCDGVPPGKITKHQETLGEIDFLEDVLQDYAGWTHYFGKHPLRRNHWGFWFLPDRCGQG